MVDEFAYLDDDRSASLEEDQPEEENDDLVSTGQRHFDSRDELNAYVRKISGPEVILSFSMGKDALGCYLVMREHFETIHLYYQYHTWPIMSFVEDKLKYFEDLFQSRIWKLPTKHFYRMLVGDVFIPPHRRRIAEQSFRNPKLWKDDDFILHSLKEWLGIPRAYQGIGVRRDDSPLRRAAIKRHGSINHKRKTYFPVFDMKKRELLDMIEAEGIVLPCDYRMFNRSFDGIRYEYASPVRRHFPEDYEKMLKMFPLLEADFKRVEFANARRVHYSQG